MANPIHSKKIQEGDKFMEEGEKCLKTSLFKWTPNHQGAAEAFSRAGLSYKMGKAYDKAEEAYVRSSTSYLQANSLFYSAKVLEDAASVCKESKKLDQAVNYLREASARYNENGNPDTGGMVLEKAAKTMEHSEPDKAAILYLEVAGLHDSEEKYREASNMLRKALNMFIRSGKLPDAIKTSNRLEHAYGKVQGWQNIHQVIAVRVLLHLHSGDVVEANQVFSEALSIIGFGNSDEAAVIERLLSAFGEGDEEEIVKCTTDPVYKCMDNDVARLAKSLKTKEIDLNASPPPSTTKQQQGNETTSNQMEETRAQLFTVTKHKQLQHQSGDSGRDKDEGTVSSATAQEGSGDDEEVKSKETHEGDTVSEKDDENEGTFDIN